MAKRANTENARWHRRPANQRNRAHKNNAQNNACVITRMAVASYLSASAYQQHDVSIYRLGIAHRISALAHLCAKQRKTCPAPGKKRSAHIV